VADLPSHRDAGDAGAGRGDHPSNPRPHWLTVVGTIAAILVVALLVALHLTGVLGPGGH
jgi:hypothetical protein